MSEEEEVEGRVKQLARWKGMAERERERDRCMMGKKAWEENKVKQDLKKRSRSNTFESGVCDSNLQKSVNFLTGKS